MISLNELLCSNILKDQDSEVQANIQQLQTKMNLVRTKYNKPMIITSGLRSKAHHIEVYKSLAAQRKVLFDLSKVPMGSAHLKGAACDVSDPDGSLFKWCKDNEAFLIKVGLWMEEKDDQARVHFQIYPPKSGNRFFKP